jgi:hypothetical protein
MGIRERTESFTVITWLFHATLLGRMRDAIIWGLTLLQPRTISDVIGARCLF